MKLLTGADKKRLLYGNTPVLKTMETKYLNEVINRLMKLMKTRRNECEEVIMTTLIVYAGKYGCTAACAEQLKNRLSATADLIDLNQGNAADISSYDNIIIGSSVYVGKVNKKIRAFVDKNLEVLLNKNIGLFLVCGQIDKYTEVLNSNYPRELLAKAASTECFGGELNPDKMGFLDRNVIRMMSKEIDIDAVQVLTMNIDRMAYTFREGVS